MTRAKKSGGTAALSQLSRRERQIMEILFELGEATAEEVRSRLPNPPSYSAARALLARLEDKGAVKHTERQLRYVYRPVISRSQARKSAVSRLVDVFFEGSVARAVTGMVDLGEDDLSDEELEALARRIAQARRRRGGK